LIVWSSSKGAGGIFQNLCSLQKYVTFNNLWAGRLLPAPSANWHGESKIQP
jgi:hypothetical protein